MRLAERAWRMRAALTGALLAVAGVAGAGPELTLKSPNGKVVFTAAVEGRRLTYRATLEGRAVIEDSPLGIRVDGVDLGEGARLGRVETYALDETFPWNGGHSKAVNRCRGARIAVAAEGKPSFTLEARAFDDAVAFRLVVPGSGRRVPDAAIAFRLPAGSTVWYHDGHRDHYEGLHVRRELKEVPAGAWAPPPVTFRLPGGAGYAAITEADLHDYAGMVLQADGRGAFLERLGHAAPPSYPYTLRYGEDDAKRLAAPAAVLGTITTPWRVVIMGPDLDALVNSDAVPSLNPPPDPKLFPEGARTSWVRAGRAVWRYLDGPSGEGRESEPPEERAKRSFEVIKDFSRMAGELGFEHQVVEGVWRRWSEDQVRELVAYSKERGVSLWFWIHSRDYRDLAKLRELLDRLRGLGVAGIKIDFFDHEARETIDYYRAVLAETAARRMLVNFHGANKPTGEARTFPNELTREGVRGLEYGRTPGWAAHNTTLPFTRFLAGHADYTPVVFGERRKDTSVTHQIATAVVFTSPAMIYGANPKSLLESPAVDVIKSLPSVWDETRVLPGSEIGEAAVFARRSGTTWFLGALNGPEARSLRVDLSFLGDGEYRATLVRDKGEDGAGLELEQRKAVSKDSLTLDLRAGGGFVGRFER